MGLDSLTLTEADSLRRLFDLGYFQGHEWDEVRTFLLGSAQVKRAVEQYRDFHGLRDADVIDADMTTSLFLPRCGLPDMARPEEAGLCKWSFADVTCAMALSGLQPLATDVEQRLYAQALANWNEVCGINLTLIPSMNAANIYSQIGNMSGSTLAYSYLPCGNTTQSTRLQQVYNKATNWTEALLLQVATHEIGHAIGLDHGPSGALMQPTANGKITKPQKWDIEQVQARYGKPKPKPQPPVPPTPPSGMRIIIPAGTVLTEGEYNVTPTGSGWDMSPQ